MAVATLEDEIQLNTEPNDLVSKLSSLREHERTMESLAVLNHAYMSGDILRDPSLKRKLQEEADNPLIWRTACSLLDDGLAMENTPLIQKALRNIIVLGMHEVPEVAEILVPLIEKHGIQSYTPPEGELAGEAARRLQLPSEGRNIIGSKLHYFLEYYRLQDIPINRERFHTAQTQDQLTEAFSDTLQNWSDAVVPHDETINQSMRVYQHLNNYFLKGKDISPEDKRKMSHILVNLFQDPYLRVRYNSLAEYLDSCDTKGFKPNPDINGQMLAFLYSIKILFDGGSQKILHPNPIFGSEPEFYRLPRINEGRRRFLKAAAVLPLAAAAVGVTSVTGRATNEAITHVLQPAMEESQRLGKFLSEDNISLGDIFSRFKDNSQPKTPTTPIPQPVTPSQSVNEGEITEKEDEVVE